MEDEIRFDDFLINEEGVFYLDQRGEREEIIPVCSPLTATATTRNTDGNDWGKLLTFSDPEGNDSGLPLLQLRNSDHGRLWRSDGG